MQNTDWWSQMILLNSLENVMIPASELAINISEAYALWNIPPGDLALLPFKKREKKGKEKGNLTVKKISKVHHCLQVKLIWNLGLNGSDTVILDMFVLWRW